MPELGFNLNLPMAEAQKFWADKVKLSPGEFARLPAAAKTKAFAVSGIAKGDELNTVFQALKSAIDKGETFGDFKARCGTIFEARGWTGERAWRVDNIFRTNIQTAYNVGRYEQMKQAAATRPYWMYSAVNDSHTRPAHRAMDGKIYPAESDFWKYWYPPNGFRCRCKVVTLSAREVERDNLTVESGDYQIGQMVSPADQSIPEGGYLPDTGFAFNPGESQWGGIVEAQTKPGKWTAWGDFKTPDNYIPLKDLELANLPELKNEILPSGQSDEFYISEFTKRYGEEKVITDALGEPLVLSLRSFLVDKNLQAERQWKFRKAGHGEAIPFLEEMAVNPFEIWLTPQINEATKQIRLTKRYIAVWRDQENKVLGLAVYESSNGVFQGVTSFLPVTKGLPDFRYLEEQRRGSRLYERRLTE